MNKYRELESQGLISLRKHPEFDIWIANYTPRVQYEKLWTDELKQCRGLVIDGSGKIVARSFPKFFNIEEHEPSEIPDETFEVFDKLDGSLGIVFYYLDNLIVATKGSFESEQAAKAKEMLIISYPWETLHSGYTYLFEIIYPENRIVVNYGADEKMVLLSIINNQNGTEITGGYEHLEGEWEIVKRFDGVKDINKLRDIGGDNQEGFVVRFKSGFRVKLKYAEYVRLHRIITGVSNKSIWEYLRDERSFDELLERVPDEFNDWVKETREGLLDQYVDINDEANMEFNDIEDIMPFVHERKEFALKAKETKFPALVFALYDDKDIDQMIWKMIKPKYQKPFKEES